MDFNQDEQTQPTQSLCVVYIESLTFADPLVKWIRGFWSG